MNIGTLDVYGRPTININMRCIEMNIGTLDVYGRPTININMRCIEILKMCFFLLL